MNIAIDFLGLYQEFSSLEFHVLINIFILLSFDKENEHSTSKEAKIYNFLNLNTKIASPSTLVSHKVETRMPIFASTTQNIFSLNGIISCKQLDGNKNKR